MHDKPKETHESYGLVQFSRVSHGPGKTRLFGSAIRDHHTTICLSVSRGEVTHDLGRDWYFGNEELIEVELSAHQFSELLTSMNSGPGVPCTIRRLNNKRVEDPPFREVEMEQVSLAFQQRMKEKTVEFNKRISELQQRLSEPGPIKASEKNKISESLGMIQQELSANVPFAMETYEEATDKIKVAAKAEVDAFVSHAIHAIGVKTLRETTTEERQKLLQPTADFDDEAT